MPGGLIREDAIRDIRERASITDVVADVVALKRRGRNAIGLCPFHGEKTPSFNVSEERGFYHCFGCGEHGDVFSFVMKTQSLAFPEAVRVVAERFGLPVPTEAAGARPRGEPLVAVNQAAATFFRASLRGAPGARCRAYLAERAITDDSIERFGLGFAPSGGDTLARHLRASGASIDDAVTAGLLARRDDGRVYDRLRDRLTFPITDLAGRVISFGGRILPGQADAAGDPPPKYLNGPESPLFKKGQTLYGLALARDAIRARDRVVVVEGYLDVIAVSQSGIGEVVAPLGTALTEGQLRVLRRFTDRVIACFDGDDAGRRAAARSFPVFVEAGLWGRAVFLPAGDDPDTFVRAHGGRALEAELDRAVPLVDAYIDALAPLRLDAVGRRVEAAREVARVLRAVESTAERDVLARLAAQRLGVREEMLRGDSRSAPAPRDVSAPSGDRAGGAEQQIVELLALEPRLAPRVGESGILADFEDPEWRRLAEAIVGRGDAGPAAVIEGLPRTLRDRVVRRLLDASDEDRERALADCMAKIRDRQRGRTRSALREALRAAEARGDQAAADAANAELNKILPEKNRT